MGRKKGPTILTATATRALATVKRNVRRRLEALGTTGTTVARAMNRNGAWITDLFLDDRYHGKISVGYVADIAEALGVELPDLVSDRPRDLQRLSTAPPPAWMLGPTTT